MIVVDADAPPARRVHAARRAGEASRCPRPTSARRSATAMSRPDLDASRRTRRLRGGAADGARKHPARAARRGRPARRRGVGVAPVLALARRYRRGSRRDPRGARRRRRRSPPRRGSARCPDDCSTRASARTRSPGSSPRSTIWSRPADRAHRRATPRCRRPAACWIALGSEPGAASRRSRPTRTTRSSSPTGPTRRRSGARCCRSPQRVNRGARPRAVFRSAAGEVMAGNPRWCLSAIGMARAVRGLDRPRRSRRRCSNAAIFFDFRAIHGEPRAGGGAARLARRVRAGPRPVPVPDGRRTRSATSRRSGSCATSCSRRGGEHPGHARPEGQRRAAVRRGGPGLRAGGSGVDRHQHARAAGGRRGRARGSRRREARRLAARHSASSRRCGCG